MLVVNRFLLSFSQRFQKLPGKHVFCMNERMTRLNVALNRIAFKCGMFTLNGYTFSFNFTPLKTQYTKHTMGNFVGLMNATLSETITFVSVKSLLQESFCPPMFIHGRVFVRPLWKWREGFYPGGVLSVFL